MIEPGVPAGAGLACQCLHWRPGYCCMREGNASAPTPPASAPSSSPAPRPPSGEG